MVVACASCWFNQLLEERMRLFLKGAVACGGGGGGCHMLSSSK